LSFRQPIPNQNLGFDMQRSVTLVKPMQSGIVARTINKDDQSLGAAPTGLAARVIADNAAARADGEVKLEMETVIIPAYNERKVVTPSGSVGIIQSFTYDTATGRTMLRFGPPAHLTPDDYRSVVKANRDFLSFK
jgi:hypothetical protein